MKEYKPEASSNGQTDSATKYGPEIEENECRIPLSPIEMDINKPEKSNSTQDNNDIYLNEDLERETDSTSALNSFVQAYNKRRNKGSLDDRAEMNKMVCTMLYDAAKLLNGNTSNKQPRGYHSKKIN